MSRKTLGAPTFPANRMTAKITALPKSGTTTWMQVPNLPVRIDGSGANVLQALKVCRHYGNTARQTA